MPSDISNFFFVIIKLSCKLSQNRDLWIILLPLLVSWLFPVTLIPCLKFLFQFVFFFLNPFMDQVTLSNTTIKNIHNYHITQACTQHSIHGMQRHAWAAIRQSHKLTKCEYSYCYNIICMHAWIVRCIELFDIIKSNVLHCSFESVDAWLCQLHELQVYLCSQPKVYTKVSGWVHQVFTYTDNYNHYIPLGMKQKASKVELLVQGKKLYHK